MTLQFWNGFGNPDIAILLHCSKPRIKIEIGNHYISILALNRNHDIAILLHMVKNPG